uniref:N-acetyltransferase domain-containing protein n=1 Tax=Amphimedon queenslandica TaxID=400682 RepID=A0A1X7T082_AMPQE
EEGLSAFEVAIDRPSSKFLSFLQRHYQLSSYVKQNNNFVVFDKFFTTCSHVG